MTGSPSGVRPWHRPRPSRTAVVVLLVGLVAWAVLVVRAAEGPWWDDVAVINQTDAAVTLRVVDPVGSVTAWHWVQPQEPATVTTVRVARGGDVQLIDLDRCRVVDHADTRWSPEQPFSLVLEERDHFIFSMGEDTASTGRLVPSVPVPSPGDCDPVDVTDRS